MTILRGINDYLGSGAVLLTAWMTLTVGCAPVGEGSEDEGSGSEVSTSSEAPGNDGESDLDQSANKGLKKDFCCVEKDGSRVTKCYNVHAIKAAAGYSCNFAPNTQVLRDGRCERYQGCFGITW